MVLSPPMWGCGLKFKKFQTTIHNAQVTPYVGVWIEMDVKKVSPFSVLVTPYVGVWIEIQVPEAHKQGNRVTPYVGVWIEIGLTATLTTAGTGHPLCGGVD